MGNRPFLLLVSDPPLRTDPDEAQEAKAVAAAEALVDRLRARGERVSLVPSPLGRADGAA